MKPRAGQQWRRRHAFRSDAPPAGRPHAADGRALAACVAGRHAGCPPAGEHGETAGRDEGPTARPTRPPSPTKARPGLHIHLFDSISVCARAPVPCPVATNNLLLLASCYCEEIEAEILRQGAACPYAERTPRYYTVQALTGLTTARSGGDR